MEAVLLMTLPQTAPAAAMVMAQKTAPTAVKAISVTAAPAMKAKATQTAATASMEISAIPGSKLRENKIMKTYQRPAEEEGWSFEELLFLVNQLCGFYFISWNLDVKKENVKLLDL